jgi:aryl-alcohol dehydrogenase-like predicted oxidoreductase
VTDEATSLAILDRYVQVGGTFIGTADNYAFWTGAQGGESEELFRRWRRSPSFPGNRRLRSFEHHVVGLGVEGET